MRSFSTQRCAGLKLLVCVVFFLLEVNGHARKGTLIFEENFNYPDGALPAIWWSEGVAASIYNGRLSVDADSTWPGVATIWLDKPFSGNMQISFDVCVVASRDLANNMNFFLLYSMPDGTSLRTTRVDRVDGAYRHYHHLQGYILTHLANGDETNGRFRLRYNPGFTLLKEQYGFECKRNTIYRVEITKLRDRIQYRVNGALVLDQVITEELDYREGYIGFRTYHTSLWWDNLQIVSISDDFSGF